MKIAQKLTATLLLAFTTAVASEGNFAKDPTCPGGLYLFATGEGFTYNLYYSDDYGESLEIVVADTYMTGGIIGDAVPGYLISHQLSINLSRDYGVSWEQTGWTPYNISAGRIPGEMYTFDWIFRERVIKYSLNYGESWDIHFPAGLYVDDFIHTVGNLEGEFYVLDTDDGELYRTTNFGYDFTYMSTIQFTGSGHGTRIRRGALPGELYLFDGYTGDLFFSPDSGLSFELTHQFSDTTFWVYVRQMVGGTQTGEVLVSMHRIYYLGGGEIFTYYSTDYGYNFTEFHPFSTTVGLPYVNLTPLDTTSFPASGGVLEYNIEGRNLGCVPYIGDIWCDVTLPDSSIYGPVMGPVQDFYLAPYWTGDRDRELTIPGNAPEGTYTLNAYIGDYDPVNPTIDAEDHLEFSKSGIDALSISSWFINYGDSFEKEYMSPITLSESDKFKLNAYPNPFNPATTLSFNLPEAEWGRLSVYNLSGQRIAEIIHGYLNPRVHQITFDASNLVSGIYVVCLDAGTYHLTQKIILVK